MSNNFEDIKFSLKVMINKQKTKVLFAEANSDFTDVLLSFLTLPLGTIVRIMNKHYGDDAPVLGSLTTLYNGLSNLDGIHFSIESGKQMLLKPTNSCQSECRKLKINVDDAPPTKYFTCESYSCGNRTHTNIGIYYGSARCACGKQLRREISVKNVHQAGGGADDGVFCIKTASFIICDDLRVVPNVAGSVMETLSNLGISDTLGAELRTVTFGFNEIMDLLKGSFLSRTPLTDIILRERPIDHSVIPNSEPKILLDQRIVKEAIIAEDKTMTLKVMVQKSTNKLLFAQAEQDFVDLLFSLLIIPLGAVEFLLGSNTTLKSMDNLYRSLANDNCDMYLKSDDKKAKLLEPKISHGYNTPNQILPLTEESAPLLYYNSNSYGEFLLPSNEERSDGNVSSFKSPKGQGSYVDGSRLYMVTDDLTVTPLCMTSSLSILNELRIPLSDVKELELHIGLEEVLSILKASLTSACALTISLTNPLLKKYLKQEK